MPWFAWALVASMVVNIAYQAYLIDRPRPRKSATEAVVAIFEVCLYIWAIVELGTHYVA